MKVAARPDPSNRTVQLPQVNTNIPANPENQKAPTSENNSPSLEDAPVHASTPWPEAGKMSGNLFKLRKDWPIPPATNTNTTNATNSNPPVIIVEPHGPEQSNPNSIVPKSEQCEWGPNCPICKNAEEDWDGEHQRQFPQIDKDTQTNAKWKPKTKMQGQPKHKTFITPKTTKHHKTSPSKHSPSMYWMIMQNKYI